MINKVILVGRVGDQPDVRLLPNSNKTMARFSLATSEPGYKTKDGREIPEKTEWHRIVFFGALADVVDRYVFKGQLLYIEGKLQTNSYEKDGIKRYSTDIIGQTLKMLSRRQDGENTNTSQEFTSNDNDDDPLFSSGDDKKEDDFPF